MGQHHWNGGSTWIGMVGQHAPESTFVGNRRQEKVRNRPIISVIDFESLRSSFLGHNIGSTVPIHWASPQIKVENFGKEPAYNFKIAVVIIEKSGDPMELHLVTRRDYSFSNPLVSGVPLDVPLMPYDVKDFANYFYKIVLRYKDFDSNEYYMDSLYYSKSTMFPAFPEDREKAEIENYLRRQ